MNLNEIRHAKLRISDFLKPTSLARCQVLERDLAFPGKIYLKFENEQPTGSFKVRAAFNLISQLSAEKKDQGVITNSIGNFALAVAYAAHFFLVRAMLILPIDTPRSKIDKIMKFNPLISFSKEAESKALMDSLIQKNGYVPLHPYNDYQSISGFGTLALEVLEQLPNVHHFFGPIGGGGLLSGCALALKETLPTIKIYGIEPAGAGDYFASRMAGKKVSLNFVDTIADGLRYPCVGELNYPLLNQFVDHVHLVSDIEIKQALAWLWKKLKVKAEPAGVVSLAGFINNHKNINGNTVILITGKNVEEEKFKEWSSSSFYP